MKAGIHPQYRTVIFHDTNADTHFKIRSTVSTSETIEFEGDTYPLVRLDISSASHPFYTGQQRQASSEGRAAQFRRRFGNFGTRNNAE
ncbi:type B 50S ribosomal protein L31 [Kushneria phyllosphaerae]|uniref:Large ribosomal subunit protein bL31B n=1 Tax=Kushneria phyllosphaerae TaxID=2100822 RepID=A0A2R8CMH4_9GAMM|nr:type B 50S ribosomal protein L31 [Kushneria phyllosphaerae]SPJ34049.1 50S ribosomal protein L31 type B [Kushneria phyllosphaerae]